MMVHGIHTPPTENRTFSGPVTHTQAATRQYDVDHDYYYRDRNGFLWWEHEGDRSDGGSIPKFFWRFVGSPFTGPVGAYRMHDLICRLAQSGEEYHGMRGATLRKYADEVVFPDAMVDYGDVVPGTTPSRFKRWLMVYLGVNLGRYKQIATGQLKKDKHAEAQRKDTVPGHRDGSDQRTGLEDVERKHTTRTDP